MSKKTLYHSELVKMSPVAARINSEPQDSQFPGKPRWVALEIEGIDRYYNCENTACELVLAGLKDQHVTLNAKGSREDATIGINDAPGKPIKEQVAPSAAASATLASRKPNGEKIRDYAAHSLRIFNIAWEESHNWVTNIPEKDAVELSVRDWYDLRLRVAQGIAIEVNKIIRKERF